jgi:hypothetical protein
VVGKSPGSGLITPVFANINCVDRNFIILSDIGVRGGISIRVHLWICGAVTRHCSRLPNGPLIVGLTDQFEVAGMYCTAERGNMIWTTDRVRRPQAQWLDVRVTFALPKRIAMRIAIGFFHYVRIKIHETRKRVERDVTLLFLFHRERLCVPVSENRFTSLSLRIGQRSNGKVPIVEPKVAPKALLISEMPLLKMLDGLPI